MKKARATKILCAVLAMVMVLGTGLSAMAASTSSIVKYNTDKTAYTVTTDVSGLTANEMVTYLVHGASSMYTITADDIEYVDQKNATGTTAQFTYTDEGTEADWPGVSGATKKIYVGAESLSAPLESTASAAEEGVAVKVNGVVVAAAVNNADQEGVKEIEVGSAVAGNVVAVYLNGTEVDFFKTADSIGIYGAALDKNDVISISTAAAIKSAADFMASDANYITEGYLQSIQSGSGALNTWNGIVSNLKGTQRGESTDYWYENTATIFDMAFLEKITISLDKGGSGIVKTADYGVLADQVEAIADDATEVTLDVTQFAPQGILLSNTSGSTIEFGLTVPVSGNYKLVGRTSSYTADRKAQVVISTDNGTVGTLAATPAAAGGLVLASSVESVALEAGIEYKITANAIGGVVRMDFLALMPDTEATTAAVASDNAMKAYLAASEATTAEAGIKLGTVKVSQNSLVAFARAYGNYTECGITVGGKKYAALGVAGQNTLENGGFAIELVDESAEADLINELGETEVAAYADSVVTAAVTPTVVE